MRLANVFYATGTSGGTLAYQKLAPTREKADKLVDERLAAPFDADANDFVYAWESSGDYDPTPVLEQIKAPLLAINSADDERNPPETGITEAAMKRVKNGRLFLIPASEDTRGHGTDGHGEVLREGAAGVPAHGAAADGGFAVGEPAPQRRAPANLRGAAPLSRRHRRRP